MNNKLLSLSLGALITLSPLAGAMHLPSKKKNFDKLVTLNLIFAKNLKKLYINNIEIKDKAIKVASGLNKKAVFRDIKKEAKTIAYEDSIDGFNYALQSKDSSKSKLKFAKAAKKLAKQYSIEGDFKSERAANKVAKQAFKIAKDTSEETKYNFKTAKRDFRTNYQNIKDINEISAIHDDINTDGYYNAYKAAWKKGGPAYKIAQKYNNAELKKAINETFKLNKMLKDQK